MYDAEVFAAIRSVVDGVVAKTLETSWLDFKEEGRSFEDTVRAVVEAVVCFANGAGGVVVLGVDDDVAGLAALKGSTSDIETLQRRIYEGTRPALVVDVREERTFGVRLLKIQVPQSPDIHSDQGGLARRRVGRDCLPMDPTDQHRLREERRGFDWSAQPTDRRFGQADSGALFVAREMLRKLPDRRRELADLVDRDLLAQLGVIGPGDTLLRAGELLFCPAPSAAQPRIRCQFRSTPTGEVTAPAAHLADPLVVAYQKAIALIEARLTAKPINLAGGQQIQLLDYPIDAVREGLANAVLHRDCALPDAVSLEHSTVELAITSPGPLVGGVTKENILRHPPHPRNPVLANAARMLGLGEQLGVGIDRMFREMVRAGKDLPEIDPSATQVRVVFKGGTGNADIARFVAQLPEREREDTDTLLVLLALSHKQTTTAEDMASLLQCPADQAQQVLLRLSDDRSALLEPTRTTHRYRYPAYRLRDEVVRALGSALSYHRRTIDETDRRVIAHIDEWSEITNETVRNLFVVKTVRANQILTDLVRREIIRKISKQQRGPGIKYGPGPKFPKKPRRTRATQSATPRKRRSQAP